MMLRFKLFALLALLSVFGGGAKLQAFTLGGPFTSWQQAAIGYQLSADDLSGPMNISEEYRVNVPVLNYAFDSTFLNYFGSKGETAVNEAFAILNSIPKAGDINLNDFPLQAKGPINFTALNLNLLDMKSFTLGTLVAQLGLGAPERFTWCLRDRVVIPNTGTTNYLVIQRNFDPFQPRVPTNVVNGTTYTYTVFDPVPNVILIGGGTLGNYADAIEVPIDIVASDFSTLGGIESPDPFRGGNLAFGEYFTGFTRDDMAAWRYLYAGNNFNIEDPPTGVALSSNTFVKSPFFSFPGASNALSTNPLVTTAVRPGIQKVQFDRVVFDSLVGTTLDLTNEYQDTYITNGTFFTQLLERAQTVPDILFLAEDLGQNPVGAPFTHTRTDPNSGWVDNSAINTAGGGVGGGGGIGGELFGPGVIEPLIQISFNRVGPHRINNLPFFVDENQAFAGFAWAHFDTANIFAIFPNGSDVEDVESRIRDGETTDRPGGSPFTQQ